MYRNDVQHRCGSHEDALGQDRSISFRGRPDDMVAALQRRGRDPHGRLAHASHSDSPCRSDVQCKRGPQARIL